MQTVKLNMFQELPLFPANVAVFGALYTIDIALNILLLVQFFSSSIGAMFTNLAPRRQTSSCYLQGCHIL